MCLRDSKASSSVKRYGAPSPRHVASPPTMTRPIGMALFGMVWLLRVRSEMKRCAKCRRECDKDGRRRLQRTPASCSTFFTIDVSNDGDGDAATTIDRSIGPGTYCEVHGFNPPKDGKWCAIWLVVFFFSPNG
ncbi:unnamed protein product [Phyllotreta striolata]|uniref:Uncharacterized protein n=1 Tax=Phyllotreta striolata TaxID=444603 RepID=A0A9N9XLG8_PHYSR|nr:unnamed protein product [Phyllotreta striolata]